MQIQIKDQVLELDESSCPKPTIMGIQSGYSKRESHKNCSLRISLIRGFVNSSETAPFGGEAEVTTNRNAKAWY